MPPKIGKQTLDLALSFYVLAGTTAALFHAERTGEGQLVDIPQVRASFWSMQVVLHWCIKDHGKLGLFDMAGDVEKLHWQSPVFTFNCYSTKDGAWVQLLGLEIKRHAIKTLKALGVLPKAIGGAAWVYLTNVAWSKEESKVVKLKPIFEVITRAIEAATSSMTLAELSALFKKHDIWHCPIRVPRQLLGLAQVRTIDASIRLYHILLHDSLPRSRPDRKQWDVAVGGLVSTTACRVPDSIFHT